mmetsp:Transcript_17136/g.37161  ORF Transcript_17136/g.37161 Transcript_17136/m.37161 type:complete len:446 (+) Transcript_17136:318-1655(+)
MRRHLKSEGSLHSRSSRQTAATTSNVSVETGHSMDSSASFRTAATTGTVGSNLLRNLIPSMRNVVVSGQEDSDDVDGRALQREVTDLRSDLDLMRANRQQEQRVYKLELHKLECEKSAMEKRIQVMLRDMEDKNAMGEYAMLIKKAAPGTIDSTYVLKLQSQLAKAMHQMGVIQNQLTLTQQACDGIVEELRNEMRKITERNSKSELDYLNQIMKLQDDNLNMKRQIESLMVGTDTDAITEEEEAEIEEENGFGAPPPIKGVIVKTNTRRRSSVEAVEGRAGRRRSNEAAEGGRGRTSRTAEPEGAETAESRRSQRKSAPTSRRSSDEGRTSPPDHHSQQRRPTRTSSGRRKPVEGAGESPPVSSSTRPSQRKSSSRGKVVEQAFGDDNAVSPLTSSSRSKEIHSGAGLPSVPDVVTKSRSTARRGDRPQRQRSSEEDGGGHESK